MCGITPNLQNVAELAYFMCSWPKTKHSWCPHLWIIFLKCQHCTKLLCCGCGASHTYWLSQTGPNDIGGSTYLLFKTSKSKTKVGKHMSQPCFAKRTWKHIHLKTPFRPSWFKHHGRLFPGSSAASEICITATTLAQQRTRALCMPQQLQQTPHKDTCPSEANSERLKRVSHGPAQGSIW